MNSFSAVHVNCTRLIMPNSPRGIQCSFIILCDETLQMTWLPEDKSGVLNFMLLIIFVPFLEASVSTVVVWMQTGNKLILTVCVFCSTSVWASALMCVGISVEFILTWVSVFAMCVLGLASPSLSQLAAFSSDWLLKERESFAGEWTRHRSAG